MDPQLGSINQTQSTLGLIGSVLVFAGVLSAPTWLVQQDRRALPGEYSLLHTSSVQQQLVDVVQSEENGDGKGNSFSHSGQTHYQQFCASCHGMPGMERIPGFVGSDLFDGVSERPFTRDDILLTLQQGILDKGMLPMQALLSEIQMEELVGYLIENQQS